MEIVQCSKGHFYDKALGKCPTCAKEEGEKKMDKVPDYFSDLDRVPDSPVIDDISETSPASFEPEKVSKKTNKDDFNEINETEPAIKSGFTSGEFGESENNKWVVEESGETEIQGLNQIKGFDPIVGWLICVKGPNRGKDYRLHSGVNFVGRDPGMDVYIQNDNTISRKDAARIVYDDRSRAFYVTQGNARGLIYLNESAVLASANIKRYDHLEIGSTEFVFVPLCSEAFSWQEV